MTTSAFRTPEDEQRYRAYFDQQGRYWDLEPGEHAAAKVILRLSPTLRPFCKILNGDLPALDMEAVLEAVETDEEVRVVMAAALSIVTVPNLARAYAGAPLWSTVEERLTAEDLAALAAAKRAKADGG